MPTEEIWQFLSRYKELITNGLDLLSFILIAPQLTRIGRAVLGAGTLSILMLIFILLMLSPIAYLVITFRLSTGWMNVAFTMSLIVGGIILVVIANKLEKLGRRVADYSFALGVFLFLLSRVVAFMIFIHDLTPAR